MNLRDHDQPCEHGSDLAHSTTGSNRYHVVWCPGGREIDIDYEAAMNVMLRIIWASRETNPIEVGEWTHKRVREQMSDFDWAVSIVDAALGGYEPTSNRQIQLSKLEKGTQ